MSRLELIKAMRGERKTYREISEVLHISKQRVHQLLKNYKVTDPTVTKKILKRDLWRCAVCDARQDVYGKNKVKLEVHHINGVKTDNEPDNLVSLCRPCHLKVECADRGMIKPRAERVVKNIKAINTPKKAI